MTITMRAKWRASVAGLATIVIGGLTITTTVGLLLALGGADRWGQAVQPEGPPPDRPG
jgi:hypothetical protein